MEKRTASKSILLCHNADGRVQNLADHVVYWAGFLNEDEAYSLPELVEQNEEQLKKRYLQWLADFGLAEIGGKRLVEHLQLRDDFSFWWTTLLIEKSQWKSPSIYAVFRLMALEQLQKDIGFTKIIFALNDTNVALTIRKWCNASGLEYEVVDPGHKVIESHLGALKIFRRLPYVIQGFVGLLHFTLLRYPLQMGSRKIEPAQGGIYIGFVSYLFNLSKDKAKQGEFYSAYWTKLHDLIKRNQINDHWLHLFVKSAYLPNAKKASELLDRFNHNENNRQTHQALGSCLGLDTVLAAIRDYSLLLRAGMKLRSVQHLFTIHDSRINVWPLFKQDWKDSIIGKTAVLNCLYLNLFEAAMRSCRCLSKGFYVMESQGWERCLIYAWKKYQQGELIGVTHATIKDWDLRHSYCYDQCSEDYVRSLPIPDRIAVNGKATEEALTRHNYPAHRLVPVEALRYLYLHEIMEECGIKRSSQQKSVRRLLVLGDSQKRVTDSMLILLRDAILDLPDDLEILFKSHPLCPVALNAWPELHMKEITSGLASCVGQYEIAFASNLSSAAVDAYLAGKRVISMRDPESFNMSPLRYFAGVAFVSSVNELLDAIRVQESNNSGIMCDYFYTEPDLNRWSSLLECSPLRTAER